MVYLFGLAFYVNLPLYICSSSYFSDLFSYCFPSLQTDMDSTNLYAYISIIALFVCIPPALIVSLVLIYLHYILNNIFLQFVSLLVFLLQDLSFLRMPNFQLFQLLFSHKHQTFN